VLCFFCASAFGIGSVAPESFRELYDHYFPKNDQYQNGEYRNWFDATLSAPPPQSNKDRHQFYRAFYGNLEAFHVFANHSDRKGEGEFTLTWNKECLVLLLKLGDEGFANLLARENKATRELVGAAIEQQVDWTKHDFPKTRSLYSYRYISPSHQAFQKTHGNKLSALIGAVAADHRFDAVRFFNRAAESPAIIVRAPKSMPAKDQAVLRDLIAKYIGEDVVLTFQ